MLFIIILFVLIQFSTQWTHSHLKFVAEERHSDFRMHSSRFISRQGEIATSLILTIMLFAYKFQYCKCACEATYQVETTVTVITVITAIPLPQVRGHVRKSTWPRFHVSSRERYIATTYKIRKAQPSAKTNHTQKAGSIAKKTHIQKAASKARQNVADTVHHVITTRRVFVIFVTSSCSSRPHRNQLL